MSGPFYWNRIPTAVWGYGLIRALAFGAPALTEDGRVGLGLLVVLPLYVYLVRGSRLAWAILVVLDAVGLALLAVGLVTADEAPLSIPLLAGLAFALLLVPSTRRFVGAASPKAEEPHGRSEA